MKVKEITVECSVCHKEDNMTLTTYNEFKLPKDWKYRTRSWNSKEEEPDEIQITCSDTCRDFLSRNIK